VFVPVAHGFDGRARDGVLTPDFAPWQLALVDQLQHALQRDAEQLASLRGGQ
jgi:hypothetical protein